MRDKLKYILIVIVILMFLITILFWHKEGELLKVINGSFGSTTEYLKVNWLVLLLLCISCSVSLMVYLKQKTYSIIVFYIFFILWALSGRTIGIHHTGELTVGWFYFETNKVVLWKKNICEGNVLESTSFREEFPFMIRYENQCVNGRVYAGPFVNIKSN